MRKLIGTFALVLMALGLLVSSVGAAVNYDPATGGFAGKGDVQTVLGYNNKQMQDNASSLSFTYVETVEYDVPCQKENRSQILRNTFERESNVTGTVSYDAKTNKQVVGFNLNPLSGTSTSNVSCPNGWEADGAPIEVGSTGGILKVNGYILPITSAS